ncbi:MAG: radical SAM family heme chaperone HemW [Pyrinomonadaceae bacterium]
MADVKPMSAGVYLHIPFCRSRCSYCDFATDVYRDASTVERYVAALCKEIETTGRNATVRERAPNAECGVRNAELNPKSKIQNPKSIDTIYFGGGTPSLLMPDQVEKILNVVRDYFAVSPNAEITMEMNPATVTPESLQAYRRLGINRASFGVQTFDDTELKRLARGHDARDARETFRMLRDAGFDNVSFDLIAGLPRQTLDDWRRNLDEALALDPEHLSLYLLEIHEGTPLAEQVRSGRQPAPDEDLAAEMYELMIDTVGSAGFRQYEISNFAKPGRESRHNSKYWLLDPVFGFGVSAHSFDGVERYANERDTAAYVRLIEKLGSAETTREAIDAESEFVFLGLRMNEGIDRVRFGDRFGSDIAGRFGDAIDELADAGLIEFDERKLRLTRRGMLVSNDVFSRFV